MEVPVGMLFSEDDNSFTDIVASQLKTKSCTVTKSSEWRQYGEKRRKHILEQDKQTTGGAIFADMNNQYSLKGYFRLSGKVVKQFHSLYETGKDAEYAYIIGHRLVNFLMYILPEHRDYMSPSQSKLRDKNLFNIVVIKKRLENLALKIDEEQCNLHIMNNYEPPHDDANDTDNEGGENITGVFSKCENYCSDRDSCAASSSTNTQSTEPLDSSSSSTHESCSNDFTNNKHGNLTSLPSLSYSSSSFSSSAKQGGNGSSSSSVKQGNEALLMANENCLVIAADEMDSREWEDFSNWPFDNDGTDKNTRTKGSTTDETPVQILGPNYKDGPWMI